MASIVASIVGSTTVHGLVGSTMDSIMGPMAPSICGL